MNAVEITNNGPETIYVGHPDVRLHNHFKPIEIKSGETKEVPNDWTAMTKKGTSSIIVFEER